METIRIAETFPSIQGEGHWTGTPCYFIRLQGCDVRCSFCDSKDTWNLSGGTLMTFQEIVDQIPDGIQHVIITGGEPTLHSNLPDLVETLALKGYRVHIETSGTYYNVLEKLIHGEYAVWITISPKYHAMPDSIDILLLADEVKWVVRNKDDLDYIDNVWTELKKSGPPLFYLQPVSCEKEATDLCFQHVIANADRDYRLSIQVHKYIDVR